MSCPPGGMCGFSSNGWQCRVAWMSPATLVSACSSAPSPIAHQGQDTSETKSILSWVVMVAVCSEWFRPAIVRAAQCPQGAYGL